MWGFYNSRDRNLANKIFELIKNPRIAYLYNKNLASPKGKDQEFLTDYVYPLVKGRSIVHDSHLCVHYGGDPFPTKRVDNCFVATISLCDANSTFYECPLKCRPNVHQDWTYC
jgi:hypothetical protein